VHPACAGQYLHSDTDFLSVANQVANGIGRAGQDVRSERLVGTDIQAVLGA
jgi:hypothetical protein